jgi:hypothetical protein
MKTVKQTTQTTNVVISPKLKLIGKPADTKKPAKSRSTAPHPSDMMQERFHQIQELAYYKAEKRGFAPGHELEDWLEAQAEVDKASRPLEIY